MSYEVPPLVASPDQPMGGADSMRALASCCALSAGCSFLAPIPVVGLGTQPQEVPGCAICAEIGGLCFVVDTLRSTNVT